MKVDIGRGAYVVAVSGGVDSVTLLHLLMSSPQKNTNRYIVAHFNHGIRPESNKEEKSVKSLARKYGLPFEVGYGKLGSLASEDRARKARYKFLRDVMDARSADKIITAHHQDDLVETAILNILRGTGPRGLSSIAANSKVERPLLNISKKEILDFASQNNLKWYEDSSNDDESYKRNYVRRTVLTRFSDGDKKKLLNEIKRAVKINKAIEFDIAKISHNVINNNKINRYNYTKLPTAVSKEVLLYWLRQNGASQLTRTEVEKADIFVRVARPHVKYSLQKRRKLVVDVKGDKVEVLSD